MSGVSNNTGKISLFNRTSIAVKATHFPSVYVYLYTFNSHRRACRFLILMGNSLRKFVIKKCLSHFIQTFFDQLLLLLLLSNSRVTVDYFVLMQRNISLPNE